MSAEDRTCVYEFGCDRPLEGETALDQELFLRNQLWNELVAIENTCRQRYRALTATSLDDEIGKIRERIKELTGLLKQKKSSAAYLTILRSRALHVTEQCLQLVRNYYKNLPCGEEQIEHKRKYKSIPWLSWNSETVLEVEDIKAGIAQLKKDLKPIYEENKALRAAKKLENSEEIETMDAERHAAATDVKKRSALYWCNKDEVFQQYQTARVRAMKDNVLLRFHRFEHEGKSTVRRSGGYAREDVFRSLEQITLKQVPQEAWDRSLGRKRKSLQWSELSMLINRTGSVLRIPICLHRPLPEGANIQSVSLIRRKLGVRFHEGRVVSNYRYRVTLTLKAPQAQLPARRSTRAQVEFCCRMQNDRSLLVASVEEGGTRSDVILPANVVRGFEHADELQRLLDSIRDETAQAILSMMERRCPEWLGEAAGTIEQWKSGRRMVGLYHVWKDKRFKGDAIAFGALAHFAERYAHLESWRENLLDKLQARRREIYRIVAAGLAKKHGALYIQKAPSPSKKNPETESQEESNKRYWRSKSALYSFWTILRSTAAREGVQVIDLDCNPELEAA